MRSTPPPKPNQRYEPAVRIVKSFLESFDLHNEPCAPGEGDPRLQESSDTDLATESTTMPDAGHYGSDGWWMKSIADIGVALHPPYPHF